MAVIVSMEVFVLSTEGEGNISDAAAQAVNPAE